MGSVDLLGLLLVFCLSLHGLEGADVWTTEGNSPVLPCGITYDPNVNLFWTLQPENIIILLKHPDGTVELLEQPFEGRVEFVDGKSLRIRNVSRLDDSSVWGGQYQCSQGSRVGERSHLHVRHPPSRVAITGYNSSSTLQPGDELQLSCDADDSNPSPSYIWYKNGIKIGEGRTVNINPVKLENNGDVIRCKVTVHDDREPVFHWEGQRQVRLSVRSRGTEASANYGIVVGIPVAVVALVVIAGVGLGVYFWRKPCNSSGSTSGTTGNSTGGQVELQEVVSESPPTTSDLEPNGHVPNGGPHTGVQAADGPGGNQDVSPPRPDPTADITGVVTGPASGPGNQAEPEAAGSTSSDDADSERPSTSQSDAPDLGPVQETAGPTGTEPVETTPLMPQSHLDEMWNKVFDIVKDELRSSQYRKRLGRKLNLSEVDISAIEEEYRQAREKVHQILYLWRERNPGKSPVDLAAALRECQCNRVAKMVEQCWESYMYGSP